MKKLLLLFLLCPLVGFSQSKYSGQGKKLFKQATQAYADGDIEKATDLFKACILREPSFAEAHLNLATINYHRGKFDLALSYAQKAYKFNRYQPEIYVQLGKAYYQYGNYDSSAVLLEMAVREFDQKSEDVHLHLAMALNKNGDHNQAIDYLNKILETNPKNASALNERGVAYFYQGNYEKAQEDFNQALNLAPGEPSVYTNLANLSIETEQADKALEYLDKALETATQKERVQLLILKGKMYHKNGDLDKAKKSFDKAFELDQNNPSVLINQASVLIDKEDYQSAWEKCNAALEQDNEMMEAYFNRGIANEMLRRTDEACLDWEQAFILGSVVAEEYLNSPVCTE